MEGKAKAELGGIVTGGSLMHSADTERKPDFSGYVTKYGLKCTDGRTIVAPAFQHQDKMTVPLVWQHQHNEPENVLGHMDLEHRDDGVYGYGFLNDTDNGKHAKTLVEHGDIKFLSIYANELKEQLKNVMHGIIRETSLVLAGANPGAMIDNVALQHGDGEVVLIEDEAVIHTGLEIEHEDKPAASGGNDNGPTVQEVYDGMSEDEKAVCHYMVEQALSGTTNDASAVAAAHSALPSKEPLNNNDNGKDVSHAMSMTRNVFEGKAGGGSGEEKHTLSHDALKGIVEDAQKRGSLKEAFEHYALQHGIDNIDILFPDAKAVDATPEFDKRRTEWVAGVLNGTRHSPFSRIKSLSADITVEEARAKGYIKGTFKKEEFFKLAKRLTSPTTIYKKQKLDRDDIIDITDIDVVAWLKGEMRLMLDEELARAILIGDGRAVDDEDKIRDPEGLPEGQGIRSIAHDHDLYAATITVGGDLTTNAGRVAFVEAVMLDMRLYKGSGSPTFYTTLPTLTNLLLTKDGMGRRLWRTATDLAAEMGVANVTAVEVMESEPGLAGIIVNLKDYTVGTDRGGDVSMFDNFDIDYNQYKYLIETRCSGALTKLRSALVVRHADAGDTEVAPTAPTFDPATGDITIIDTAGVVYRRGDTEAIVTAADSPINVAAGDSLIITSEPDGTHYFDNNVEDQWLFERPAA